MNDPFDDDTTDSILTGVGTGDDPALARVLDVARESFTATEPVLGTELAAFFAATA